MDTRILDNRDQVSILKDEIGERCQGLFLDFLETFNFEGEAKYFNKAKSMDKPERNTLTVSFPDVEVHNPQLGKIITEEYIRVYPYLCEALRIFVREHAQVRFQNEYYVAFADVPTSIKVRDLTMARVGTLTRISGQVVRTHPVHPELVAGTFTCNDCSTEHRDVEQQFKYTQPAICRNPHCQNRTDFTLDSSRSRFVDFQKVRIQETQSELPRGCIPRSVDIILRGEMVETAQAGDRSDFIGTLIVVPDVGSISMPGVQADTQSRKGNQSTDMDGVRGLKSLGVRDLHYKTAFLACSVQSSNPKFSNTEIRSEGLTAELLKKQMTDDEWLKIFEMSRDKNLLQNLTTSLFPTIHGNEEVKKGIVLMLFGGVPKKTGEGTSLRGDVNVCIVGDPSCAKSQFLKQVADFSPRAVYTSGKASSAAGLTAAVVKDEESFEFVIEAGALMLADNGICCIDEFDKMDPKDQVAIHEAMEQQTISITKAGVKATLNARTSILAAANPVGGRYDRAKSLRQNITLTAPIMSRFDLFFILVDECNEVMDYSIAQRIVDLHCRNEESIERVYSPEYILKYLLFARQFKPTISREAGDLLVENYKRLRQRDGGGVSQSAWRITVRQLESMIRLSEAMAKLYCCEEVTENHVKEAYRLLSHSIIRIEQPDVNLEEEEDDMRTEAGQAEARQEAPSSDERQDSGAPPTKKLKISYEEYKSIGNLMIMYMRKEEARMEESGNETGLRKSDVINWYLGEIETEIESTEELGDKKLLLEKIMDRLMYHDQVIIPLSGTGLRSKSRDEDTQETEDPIVVVHPDYVLEI